jgi:hypothetical protein
MVMAAPMRSNSSSPACRGDGGGRRARDRAGQGVTAGLIPMLRGGSHHTPGSSLSPTRSRWPTVPAAVAAGKRMIIPGPGPSDGLARRAQGQVGHAAEAERVQEPMPSAACPGWRTPAAEGRAARVVEHASVVLVLLAGQGVSERVSAMTATGRGALALASLVADLSPTNRARDRTALSQMLNGRAAVSFPPGRRSRCGPTQWSVG